MADILAVAVDKPNLVWGKRT